MTELQKTDWNSLESRRGYFRAYYQATQQRRRQLASDVREANREKIALQRRGYRVRNAERINACTRSRYAVDPEFKQRRSAAAKRWYAKNADRMKAKDRELREVARLEMIEAYGGKCSCPTCPETNPAFLTADHINGNGRQHRQTTRRDNIARWLKRNGWPKDIQLLCYNCNCGRQFRGQGTCPHVLKTGDK